MKKKIIVTVVIIVIISLMLCFLTSLVFIKETIKPVDIAVSKNTPQKTLKSSIAKHAILKKIIHTPIAKPITVTTKNNTLKQVSFDELPGWNETEIKKSMLAFQGSCKTFLKQKPSYPVGSKLIDLQAKDWHPACKEALLINPGSEVSARTFFEKWFYPIEFSEKKSPRGLFTGYYMPQLKGNLTQTKQYNIPIYGLPRDLKQNSATSHKKKSAYFTRAEIDQGAIKKKAPVIAWIKSPVERLFLEIEGSGVIQLTSGENLYLGYAGENGAPYSSISKVLIKKGVMNKDNASKKAIKRYLESQPQKANDIIHKNKSFVFFQKLEDLMGLGSQGIALTPGYSLAIDKKWIPIGAPLWLTTKVPDEKKDEDIQFQRLMIA
ncbi:MAG: MltA domain-containing protein, partial [bacterium]|nr:MltA domain-containing protein [bacterium]